MSTVIDSYSESNKNDYYSLSSSLILGGAQMFTVPAGASYTLDSVKWYVSKDSGNTGTAYAKIYAITGDYGTTAKPTGSALATATFDVSTASTWPTFALATITFAGADRITLTPGYYAVSLEFSGAKSLHVGERSASGAHSGDLSLLNYPTAGVWNNGRGNTEDACFYVYGDPVTSIKDIISCGIIAFPR
jgi:hypothetical protein